MPVVTEIFQKGYHREMRKTRIMIVAAALAAVMALSGCQESKVVETVPPETTPVTTVTEETTTEAVTSETTTTTTKATTTTTTTTTAAETTPAETEPAVTTTASGTGTPVAVTAATAAQNPSGVSTGGSHTPAAPAATTAPQTAAQTYATTLAHVSGYRYGSTKYEIKHDFEYMRDLNSDFVGWLKVDDTPIDLPILQASDNKFYLEHDFWGNYDYTKVGCSFADCHVPITETSRPDNVVIYGHNIRTGAGLAKLTNYYPARYGSLNFYITHPIISFESLDGGKSQYVVFAGMFVNTQTKHGDVFNYYQIREFTSESLFYRYFEAVFDRSVFYNPDLDVQYGDDILTLSTCFYPFGANVDTRFVVFARRIRKGETSVSTLNAYTNRSPLYFDYYYQVNGGSWAGRKWPESLIKGYSEWKKTHP
jgi:sortase B